MRTPPHFNVDHTLNTNHLNGHPINDHYYSISQDPANMSSNTTTTTLSSIASHSSSTNNNNNPNPTPILNTFNLEILPIPKSNPNPFKSMPVFNVHNKRSLSPPYLNGILNNNNNNNNNNICPPPNKKQRTIISSPLSSLSMIKSDDIALPSLNTSFQSSYNDK